MIFKIISALILIASIAAVFFGETLIGIYLLLLIIAIQVSEIAEKK